MGYASFLANEWTPSVVISEVESQRAGLKIGRIEIPHSVQISDDELQRLLLDSPADLTVVRYPAEQTQMAAHLIHPDLVSIQADTLLYFEGTTDTRSTEGLRVDIAVADDAETVSQLLGDIFDGYANHYSANPLLGHIDVAEAYIDWAVSVLDDPNHRIVIAKNAANHPVGVAVIDVRHADFNEVLLAGITSTLRRQGFYRRLLSALLNLSRSTGKHRLVISTQAGNIAAMRAWSDVGLLPSLALNTLHVMNQDFYRRLSA